MTDVQAHIVSDEAANHAAAMMEAAYPEKESIGYLFFGGSPLAGDVDVRRLEGELAEVLRRHGFQFLTSATPANAGPVEEE